MLLVGLRVKIVLLVCVEVLLLDVILLDELPDGALLGWEILGPVVLLKPVKPEDLGVLAIIEGLGELDLVGDLKVLDLMEDLLDGAGLGALAEGLLTGGALWTFGADETLEDDPLLRLLLLDLELLLRILADSTGSAKQSKARASVTRAILGISLYLGVHILLLLSSALVLGQ